MNASQGVRLDLSPKELQALHLARYNRRTKNKSRPTADDAKGHPDKGPESLDDSVQIERWNRIKEKNAKQKGRGVGPQHISDYRAASEQQNGRGVGLLSQEEEKADSYAIGGLRDDLTETMGELQGSVNVTARRFTDPEHMPLGLRLSVETPRSSASVDSLCSPARLNQQMQQLALRHEHSLESTLRQSVVRQNLPQESQHRSSPNDSSQNHSSQYHSPQHHTSQNYKSQNHGSGWDHGSQRPSSENHILQNHSSQNYNPPDHKSHSYNPPDHSSQNHTPQNHTPQNHGSQGHSSQNHVPQNHGSQGHSSQNHSFQSHSAHHHTERLPEHRQRQAEGDVHSIWRQATENEHQRRIEQENAHEKRAFEKYNYDTYQRYNTLQEDAGRGAFYAGQGEASPNNVLCGEPSQSQPLRCQDVMGHGGEHHHVSSRGHAETNHHWRTDNTPAQTPRPPPPPSFERPLRETLQRSRLYHKISGDGGQPSGDLGGGVHANPPGRQLSYPPTSPTHFFSPHGLHWPPTLQGSLSFEAGRGADPPQRDFRMVPPKTEPSESLGRMGEAATPRFSSSALPAGFCKPDAEPSVAPPGFWTEAGAALTPPARRLARSYPRQYPAPPAVEDLNRTYPPQHMPQSVLEYASLTPEQYPPFPNQTFPSRGVPHRSRANSCARPPLDHYLVQEQPPARESGQLRRSSGEGPPSEGFGESHRRQSDPVFDQEGPRGDGLGRTGGKSQNATPGEAEAPSPYPMFAGRSQQQEDGPPEETGLPSPPGRNKRAMSVTSSSRVPPSLISLLRDYYGSKSGKEPIIATPEGLCSLSRTYPPNRTKLPGPGLDSFLGGEVFGTPLEFIQPHEPAQHSPASVLHLRRNTYSESTQSRGPPASGGDSSLISSRPPKTPRAYPSPRVRSWLRSSTGGDSQNEGRSAQNSNTLGGTESLRQSEGGERDAGSRLHGRGRSRRTSASGGQGAAHDGERGDRGNLEKRLDRSKARPGQQLLTRVGCSTPETSGNEECTPETTELVNTWLDGITSVRSEAASARIGSSSEDSVTQERPKGFVGDGMLDQAQPDGSRERETGPRGENDVEASQGNQGLERSASRRGGQKTGRVESERGQAKDYLSKDSHYSGGTGGTSGTDWWGSSEQTQDFQTPARSDHSPSRGPTEHGAGGLERQVSILDHGAAGGERTPAGTDDDRNLAQDAKSTNGVMSVSGTSSDGRRYAAAVRMDHLTLQDWVTFAVDQQESQEGAVWRTGEYGANVADAEHGPNSAEDERRGQIEASRHIGSSAFQSEHERLPIREEEQRPTGLSAQEGGGIEVANHPPSKNWHSGSLKTSKPKGPQRHSYDDRHFARENGITRIPGEGPFDVRRTRRFSGSNVRALEQGHSEFEAQQQAGRTGELHRGFPDAEGSAVPNM